MEDKWKEAVAKEREQLFGNKIYAELKPIPRIDILGRGMLIQNFDMPGRKGNGNQ